MALAPRSAAAPSVLLNLKVLAGGPVIPHPGTLASGPPRSQPVALPPPIKF